MLTKSDSPYPEYDIFEPQLRGQSIQVPIRIQRNRFMHANQQKYQIDQLRQQIAKKCEKIEMQYIIEVEKEKSLAQKNRKKEEAIAMYMKLQAKHSEDALDILLKDKDGSDQKKMKTQKGEGWSREKIESEYKKEQMKEKILKSYRFTIENQPRNKLEEIEEKWWINKVKRYRQKEEAESRS